VGVPDADVDVVGDAAGVTGEGLAEVLAGEPDVSALTGLDASEALSDEACGAVPVAGFWPSRKSVTYQPEPLS
jgi:hypothetical protein